VSPWDTSSSCSWVSSYLACSSSRCTCTIEQLGNQWKVVFAELLLSPNSEWNSIMLCAVKSSFLKPVYRSLSLSPSPSLSLSRDQLYRFLFIFWQKLVFTLQIEDHFFLDLNSGISCETLPFIQ
jgi:hypothetical protein